MITAAKRASLPSSAFALPAQRKYPMDTPGRARNAVSRAAQNLSPAEAAKVKAKAHRVLATKFHEPVQQTRNG
jgi:hypothetical protein